MTKPSSRTRPPHMSFQYTSANRTSQLACNLESKQCAATNKNGKHCGRTTVRQLPYCNQHSKTELGVEIKKSTIPSAGFGLFAMKLFRKNDKIAPYDGRTITNEQKKTMYGTTKNDQAPYAVKISRDSFKDAACKRATGAFVNNKPNHNNSKLAVNHTNNTVTVKATKRINPGQEIFAAYGPGYFPRPNDLPKPTFTTKSYKRKYETE